jgi:H+-transporting ATPase
MEKRLALTASVRRDGAWKNLPAVDLVPDDIIKLSLGGIVAADVKLLEGNVVLDQSMPTGESIGSEAGMKVFIVPAACLLIYGGKDAEKSQQTVAAPSH